MRFSRIFCHHCLSLKAALSSRLRDSATVWSAEAFNTTGVVVRLLVSHLSFSLALLRGDQPRTASTRLHPKAAPVRASLRRRLPAEYCETSCERLSCGIPTSAECFEASLPLLPGSSRAPTIMFWTLRFCVPLLVDPPSHLEEHLLEHLHPLLFAARSHWVALALFTIFSNTSSLVRLLLAMLFLHGSLGPNPGCYFMGPGVPIPACFSFFTSIWHVFHPPHPVISVPTSPSESRLSIHPWNQLNSDVTSFKNTQAFRENRNHHSHHHLPRTTGMSNTLSMR